jgi:SOS regulatory protein LexA
MAQLDEHGARILAFVERYQRQHHRSPTYREIGAAVGLGSNDHVARDLRRLVKQGYLSFTPGVSRSIVLLKTPRARTRAVTLPLPNLDHHVDAKPKRDALDEIAAGLFQDEQDTFLLRAHGTAMQDAFLEDGDLVVVKRGEDFQDGDMLAVYLRPAKRTTLKYLYRDNGRVRAHSPNPDAPPEHFRFSELEIRGTVLAILRKREM